MNNTMVVGMILTGVAMLLCIVSAAIPYWWSSEYVDIGLFKICAGTAKTGSTCMGYTDNVSDWIKATRAMMILSILALGASLLLSIYLCCVMKDKQFLALGAACMSFAAAVLALLGVVIFAAKFPFDTYDLLFGEGSLHAGFGLAIAAVIVAFVAGGILFCSKNRNASSHRNVELHILSI